MRASQWVLGLATASAMVAAIAVGCGGSTSGGNATDSGVADVTTEKAVEAAVEAASEAGVDAPPEACTSDVNITDLPIPDASIGETGATVAGCVSCVETACPSLPAVCDMTCGCPAAFIGFEQCLGAGGSILTCAGGLAEGAGIPLTSLACAAACSPQCGLGTVIGGEGGVVEGGGGDAPTDAVGQ